MMITNLIKRADSAWAWGDFAQAANLYRDVAESMEYDAWVSVGDNNHCNAHIFWSLAARANKESVA